MINYLFSTASCSPGDRPPIKLTIRRHGKPFLAKNSEISSHCWKV